MAQAFTDPLKLRFHSDDEPAEKVINYWSHDHPLFLTVVPPQAKNNNMPTDDDPITVCHCCVRPISSSTYYYSCKHDGCSFTLHKYCVELPRTLQQHALHQQRDHPLHLVKLVHTFLLCDACDKRCNTFFYECGQRDCYFRIDVNCAFLPKIIKHEYFHKEHHLVQHTGPSWISRCKICEQNFYKHVGYKCDACNFRLDLHCALKSPYSLPHRYCKGGHEVPLMCPPIEDHPEDFYCEICEEEMNPLIPLYYCGKCKNSFHIRCLSRVYRYENYLREGSLNDPYYHNHPLTFVRRKKPSKEVCYRCNGDINGFLFLECRTGNCSYCLCLECWEPHPEHI
uniref:uncharacterized protein LOC122609292 n=1 Tax=Erigeron canadensis TaxID=72917 RepID=UPI001CB8BE45|nr:uncharacterized protein LOC122609292 [Erigeron canadensis]